MTWWRKPVALAAMTIGCLSLELFLAWILNAPIFAVLPAGLAARATVGGVFAKTFAKAHEPGRRFRLQVGAAFCLTAQGYAFLCPSIGTVSVAVVFAVFGYGLIWWDEWQETSASHLAKMLRDPAAIPPQEREQIIRVRIAEILEEVEPKQDELAGLKEELHTLEQKKGYRGK